MDVTTTAPSANLQQAPPWRDICLFLLTFACVAVSLAFTHILLFSIVGAITLAVSTHRLATWMNRRLSPTVTATLLVLAVVLAVLLPAILMARDLINELMDFVHFIQSGAAEQFLQRTAHNHQKIGGFLQREAQQFDITSYGKQLAGITATQLGRALQGIAGGITTAILLLFFFFFLVRDQKAATAALRSIVPLHDSDTYDLLRQMGDVIDATFTGRLLIAVIQGALSGAAYLLLGVPGVVLWSALTIVCCIIPAFGSFIAWIPIALYLGLSQSWTKAGILALWGGLVVGNIDNVLYPVLVGQKTDLHTAIIFVAIFGGLAVFGMSGFVLGPVIVAATIFLLGVWKRKISAA